MAKIQSREDLAQFCLRQLGEPVIDVNVAPEQIDDAIDNAYDFWAEYHYLGTENAYAVLELDETDIENQYLTLPDEIVEVVNLYMNSGGNALKGMSDPFYRMRLNDLHTGTGFFSGGNNLINYYVARSYYSMLEDTMNPDISYEFSKYTHRLKPRINWKTDVRPGTKIMVELVRRVTPEENAEIWNDWVLRKLATEYTRRQWGYNLIKMGNIQLPGGASLNGQTILDEATREIEKIEEDFIYKYSAPLGIMIG